MLLDLIVHVGVSSSRGHELLKNRDHVILIIVTPTPNTMSVI